MPHLKLGVLGTLQVAFANAPTAKLESDKTRALLVYLAVEADRAHRREALTGLLWPDFPEETARRNLRQALFNLRQVLGDHTANPPYLLITHDELEFNTASDHSLDFAQFDAQLAAVASHAHRKLEACTVCAARLQEAVGLYRGKFLQEFFLEDSAEFEEWAVARREATHQRALEALTHLADYYENRGEMAAARVCTIRQLELDPWREQAHRRMMRIYAFEGQRSSALAQYETCRRVLSEEFGVEPSEETRELYEKIKAVPSQVAGGGRRQLGARDSAVSRQPSSLPQFLAPFIGRERELAELARLVAEPTCRFLTLFGPGGMGKTRLAIQVATNHRSEFEQGVAFTQLAGITSTELVIPAIADALGFSFYGPTSPRIQLANYLRDKQMLLILDNVEQLTDAAEIFVELLQHAPAIKFLLTSREPLNLQSEWVFEVSGLAVPTNKQEPFEESDAVQLFLQRARRTRTGILLNDQERSSVVRLCRLVGGMPLALELAATWVRALSVAEIVTEIEGNLGFLSASIRDLPERHRSVRAVFDHSWQMLSPEEQRVLAKMSVLRGDFQRDAADQVAGAALSLLSALVSKSLVRRTVSGRYNLHELIRQYAVEQLAGRPEEESATQARHAKYYLTYFSQADRRLRSSAQLEALEELTAEMDNLRAAWDWAVTHGEFALIEDTMRTFVRLYDTRGWFQEGLDTLGRALDVLEMTHGPSPHNKTERVALAHLLAARAWLAYRLANYEQAQTMLERSVEILRPLNEPHVLVESITYLGRVMEMTGNYARASELYSEGLEMATAIDDRWFKAVCLTLHTALIGLTQSMAKPEITHDRLQSVVAEWRLIGDPRLIALALDFLSRSALRLGQYDQARAALEENEALNRSIGFGWGLGTAYRGLGLVAQAEGGHQRAVEMFRKSLDTFTELGGSWWVARVQADMGKSILALGKDTEAGRVWREALRLANDIHATPVALEALAGIASLHANQGDREEALALLLIVLNHSASSKKTRDLVTGQRAELEAQLASQQVEAAQARAVDRTFEEVVKEVLKQADLS